MQTGGAIAIAVEVGGKIEIRWCMHVAVHMRTYVHAYAYTSRILRMHVRTLIYIYIAMVTRTRVLKLS